MYYIIFLFSFVLSRPRVIIYYYLTSKATDVAAASVWSWRIHIPVTHGWPPPPPLRIRPVTIRSAVRIPRPRNTMVRRESDWPTGFVLFCFCFFFHSFRRTECASIFYTGIDRPARYAKSSTPQRLVFPDVTYCYYFCFCLHFRGPLCPEII